VLENPKKFFDGNYNTYSQKCEIVKRGCEILG
jgi:hypothetical protein